MAESVERANRRLAAAAFQLEHVSYAHESGEPALVNVSFEIRPGERVALLGPNGSGKTTLQKLLDGLITPTSGRIIAFGQPLTAATLAEEEFAFAFRRRVGFIFQNSEAQLFCSTVSDEIAFGPLQLGWPTAKVQQRVAEILAMLDLEALAGRPPYRLSGGEKKKVAIGAVLAVDPEVLILDEPTNALDPRAQHWLVALLAELGCAGKTIITATHHLDVIPELADRVLVFGENHQLVADDTPEAVLADKALLLRVNLVDESYHTHRHGTGQHFHLHE